jgi:hypothetical protein
MILLLNERCSEFYFYEANDLNCETCCLEELGLSFAYTMCIRHSPLPVEQPRKKTSPAHVYPPALGTKSIASETPETVPTRQFTMAAPAQAQAQVLPLLRWSRSASFLCASSRRLFSALQRPSAAARCEAGSKAMLKGMDYSELEVRAWLKTCWVLGSSLVVSYARVRWFSAGFFQNWVQAQGFRPGQAMMLWKCLYGNNVWAHCYDELAGKFSLCQVESIYLALVYAITNPCVSNYSSV